MTLGLRLLLRRACALAAGLALGASGAAYAQDPPEPFDVLVFSKTGGFRHVDSINAGKLRIADLAEQHGFNADFSEDAADFTEANLASYEAVVFLNTTTQPGGTANDLLDANQQAAFEDYMRAGGGWVGIHAAADTEKPGDGGVAWPWYGDLLGNGAWFHSHPHNQTATIRIEDPDHPATAHLGPTWQVYDEWYNYRANPRSTVHVLATLDESTYTGGNMGADHPIAWCQYHDGGRAFYTGRGHTAEAWGEDAFQKHVLGAIRWAAGVAPGNCDAPGEDSVRPTATATLDPAEPDRADGRYSGPVTITLAGEDNLADPVQLEYRFAGGEWREYTEPILVSDPGAHTLDYRALDDHGNESEPASVSFAIAGPPALSLKVRPAKKRIAAKRAVNVRAVLANAGDSEADAVRICARAQKRLARLQPAKCLAFDTIEAGARERVAFRLKLRPKARGKRVNVKVTATTADAGKLTGRSVLRAKRR